MEMKRILAYFTCALLTWAGCQNTETPNPEVEKLGRATGPVGSGSVGSGPIGSGAHTPGVATMKMKVHSGQVVETMNVPNYTYLQIMTSAGEKLWAAIPKTDIRVGQSVEVMESTVMKNFASRTLNKTFPTIIFGTAELKVDRDSGVLKEAGAKEVPAGQGATPMMSTKKLPPGHPPINRPTDSTAGKTK
ncbi:MAG: hypothetical protein GY847_26025 [Proteobacteria bacterium]|nr:hypothetical protein [Pseudomonadota bacterium]